MKRFLKRFAKLILLVLLVLVVVIGVRLLLGWFLAKEPQLPGADDPALRERALAIHRQATVFDGHNDLPVWMLNFGFDMGMDGNQPDDRSPLLYMVGPFANSSRRPTGDEVRTHTDLGRIREGGLDAQFFAIWVACSYSETPGAPMQRALDMIANLKQQLDRHRDAAELALTTADVQRIVAGERLAALIGVEGGHAIENDLDNLRLLFDEGARYMTLNHTCSHSWADSSTDEPIANGLSDFGSEVVHEMNRLGMIVDVSHVADSTFWDVIETTEAPIIASHSSARAIADHPRNLDDDMLRAVRDNDGVVMINFMPSYLDPAKTSPGKLLAHWLFHPGGSGTPLAILVDHIDHVVEGAGIDHVGLGSDFDGVPFLPVGLDHVGDLPNITVELVRRGYDEEQIGKILGGNILRVLAAVENAAAAAEQPPATVAAENPAAS